MVMNKTLEALENIKHYDTRVGLHRDDYDTIEKSLKALEIIKKRKVDVNRLISCIEIYDTDELALYKYNSCAVGEINKKEEYDLLKEVLLWTYQRLQKIMSAYI